MRTRSSIGFSSRVIVATGTALLLMCVGDTGGIAQSRRQRVIPYRIGESIASRLLSDDDLVIVKRSFEGAVWSQPPTAAQELDNLLFYTHAALLVDAERVGGIVTEGGSWIETRVTAVIRDVLVQKQQAFSVGQRMEMQSAGGGELSMGQILVRAGMPVGMREGHRHLLFVYQNSTTGVVSPTKAFLIEDNGRLNDLVRSDSSDGVPSALHDLSLEQVREEVRRLVNQRR